MTWSGTELQVRACCQLTQECDELDRIAACVLLSKCVVDYEEKNNQALITITAPSPFYDKLEVLNNSFSMYNANSDGILQPVIRVLPFDELTNCNLADYVDYDLVIYHIYRTFTEIVLDPKSDTPLKVLRFHIKETPETTGTALQRQETGGEYPEGLSVEKSEMILRFLSTKAGLAVLSLERTSDQDVNVESSVDNQCRQFDNNQAVHIWEKLRFRSHTEIRIAQALDKRKVLFLPNSGWLLTTAEP